MALPSKYQPVSKMLFLFVVSMLGGTFLAPLFAIEGMQAFGSGNEDNPLNPLYYIVVVILFTIAVLWIAKRRKKKVIKWIFLFALGMTILYVLTPIVQFTMFPPHSLSSDEYMDIMASGGDNTLYYTEGNKLYAMGNTSGSVVLPEKPLSVSASSEIVCALYDNGTVDIFTASLNPVRSVDLNASTVVSSGSNVVLSNNTGLWILRNVTTAPITEKISDYNYRHIHAHDGYVTAWTNGRVLFYDSRDSRLEEKNISHVNYCAAGDFNGDGMGEVAVIHDGRKVAIFNSSFSELYSAIGPRHIIGLDAGDVDMDEVTDIIVIEDRDIHVLFYSKETSTWSSYYSLASEYWISTHIDHAVGLAEGNHYRIYIKGDGRVNHADIQFTDPGPVIYLPSIIGFLGAVLLTALLFRNPEWYVVDTVGVLVASGAIAIFGISLGILPAIILLVILAIYDAISVYKTKHMIDLADTVMDLKLPILLVIPKKKGYSFKTQAGLKKELRSGERGAMFMGLGDVIIPSILGVSAMNFLPDNTLFMFMGISFGYNAAVALFSFVGAIIGYFILMRFVLKGNPQAGLPLLNSGAIIGYIIGYLIIFGDPSLGITLVW